MKTFFTALFGGLAAAAIVVAGLGAVTGGYVYRTTCPAVGGSVQTDWSYRIQDVLPYVGYSRSGCQVETGTRVVLNTVGIWKIPAVYSEAVDHSAEYTTRQMSQLDTDCVRHSGKGAAYCGCATNELARRFTPAELVQIAGVTRYDQLPSGLASRDRVAVAAIDQGC